MRRARSHQELDAQRYQHMLRAMKAEPNAVAVALQLSRVADITLDAHECPWCGKTIRGTHRKRASEMAAVRGYWVEYECSCGFMRTRIEDPPS